MAQCSGWRPAGADGSHHLFLLFTLFNAQHGGATRSGSVVVREVTRESVLDIEALYQQYRVRIFRAIAGVVFDDAAAEDLTQETFERAWRSRASYRGAAEEVGAWLYRIAMNTAMSWLRRQKLARLLPTRLFGGDADSGGMELVENRQLADVALAALSPKLRVVVVMTYYSGLTRQEIAAALGVPPGTVASRLALAQQTMRAALEQPAAAAVRRAGDQASA
jgi:RNA polymerase sigma-70 factor (ECF subfamily)